MMVALELSLEPEAAVLKVTNCLEAAVQEDGEDLNCHMVAEGQAKSLPKSPSAVESVTEACTA